MLFHVSYAVLAVSVVFAVEISAIQTRLPWMMGGLAAQWCAWDARRRGRPLLPIVQHVTLMGWGVMVPLYLIRTRRWRGVAVLLLNIIVLGDTAGVCQLLASMF